jgi:enamine deaminase RidA (YjgF/YER057c/UK114 family)
MKREFIQLAGEKTQGIDALQGTSGAAYSDSVRIDLADHTLLFISGKTGAKDGKLVGRGMREQTRQTLENIRSTLEGQGGSMADIVRFRIYVTQCDQESIRDVHAVRAEYFAAGRFPASTLVRVDQLVRDGALIEIEADVVMARQ